MADTTLVADTTRKALGWSAVVEAIDLTGVLQRELANPDTGESIRTVGPSLPRRIDELQHQVLDVLDANELSVDEMRRVICGARKAGG